MDDHWLALILGQSASRDEALAILNYLPDGMGVFRTVGDSIALLYANDMFYDMCGYENNAASDVYRQDVTQLIHEEDVAELRHLNTRSSRDGIPFTHTLRLRHPDGEYSWLMLRSRPITRYDSGELLNFVTLVDVSTEKEMEKALEYRAQFDSLTGIYNKDNFFRATRELLEKDPQIQYSLVRLNVERFKVINDLFGADAGDGILKQIAAQLHGTLPGVGTYGRLEADNFAFCMPTALLDVEGFIRKMQDNFRQKGLTYPIMIAFGIYDITEPSIPVDQMCDRATLALQTIKGDYVKRYARYDDSLRSLLLEEQVILAEMRDALETNQFTIFLQPIYSLTLKEAISAEALVRWEHPREGVVLPDQFIPLFERNGFIERMDRFVWEETCKYLADRRRRKLSLLPISVNVSRRSLYNPALCDDIIGLVERYALEPSLLKLEITESAYTDNPEQLLHTIQKLQVYGFEILMDDFGSGYSSLNMLKDIPVDTLKIDMRFLKGFESSNRAGNILTSVVRMAKWLHVPVIAEGVETGMQVDYLRSIGCDQMQGFYFSEPVTIPIFEQVCKQQIELVAAPLQLSAEESDFDQLFNGNQLMSRLFNSVIGGVGIYELDGDRLEVIRVNDGYYDLLGYDPQSFYAVGHDAMNRIFDVDKAPFLAACKRAVEEQGAEVIEFRAHRRDGGVLWLGTNIRYLGGTPERPLICLAMNDITTQKINEHNLRKKNAELARERMINKYVEEAGAIIMEWDMTTHSFYCSKAFYGYEASNRDPFAVFEPDASLTSIHPDDVPALREFVRNKEFSRAMREIEMRLLRLDGAYVWCRFSVVFIYDDNEFLIRVIVTCANIDEKKQADIAFASKSAQLQAMMDNMIAGICLFEVTDVAKAVYISKGYLNIIGYTRQEYEALKDTTMIGVFPEDAKNIMNLAQEAVRTQSSFQYKYRVRRKDGQVIWLNSQTTALPYLGKEYPRLMAVILDVTKEEHAKQKIQEATETLNNIIANLPVGIAIFEFLTKGVQLQFASQQTCDILGYSLEEYREIVKRGGGNFAPGTGMVNRWLKRAGKDTSFERIISRRRKDGVDIWIRITGSVVENMLGRSVCYCTMADVTDTIRRQRSVHWQEERYHVLLQSINAIIFDYDPIKDIFSYSAKTPETGLTDYVIEHYMEELPQSGIVHPDSFRAYEEALLEASVVKTSCTVEYIANHLGAGYSWCRAQFVSVADDTGNVYRVVGRVDDIQKEKEDAEARRRREDALRMKAEYDSVTGLFNRATVEELVTAQLAGNPSESQAVFMAFDIDNFKRINDTYGHLCGDRLLRKVGALARRACRKTDIVGRIGGDEFAVYLCSIPSMELATQKVESVSALIRALPEKMGLETTVSISIGITRIEPTDKSFRDVFERADRALYHAKQMGKDQYAIYKEDNDTE